MTEERYRNSNVIFQILQEETDDMNFWCMKCIVEFNREKLSNTTSHKEIKDI